MIPSHEQLEQQKIFNDKAIREHGIDFIPCCHQQTMVKNGKCNKNEDRYVCVYCGMVLSKSTTEEESPIIICGERELIDLRRRNGLKELADSLESYILKEHDSIPDDELIIDIDAIIGKPKRRTDAYR